MKQINNRTKIIATIGPSSSDYDILKEMIKSGVDVVRLNFSHGDIESHRNNLEIIKSLSECIFNCLFIIVIIANI